MSRLDRGLLWLSRAGQLWRQLLERVRSRLPVPWRQRLSDGVLSAISVGVLALLLIVITSGGEPTPVAEPTAPPPEPTVAIEPSEIPEVSNLQTQVADITAAYASDMVQTVEADFRQKTVTIRLGAQWYGLMPSQQDQLAQDLYSRLEDSSFNHLYLQDPEGVIIARNPVIGNQMVILQRRSAEAGILGSR